MALIRWDPWAELNALERQLNSLLSRSGGRSSEGDWSPPLDVHQEGDTMVICAEIPGVDPGDVDISVENDVLTLSGSREDHREVQEGEWIRRERFSGRFQRSLRLPPGVDPQSIQASENHGVIQIRVPRPATTGRHQVSLRPGGGNQEADSGTTGQIGGETMSESSAQASGQPSTRSAGSAGQSGGSSSGSSGTSGGSSSQSGGSSGTEGIEPGA